MNVALKDLSYNENNTRVLVRIILLTAIDSSFLAMILDLTRDSAVSPVVSLIDIDIGIDMLKFKLVDAVSSSSSFLESYPECNPEHIHMSKK